jgi:hypothetical protein
MSAPNIKPSLVFDATHRHLVACWDAWIAEIAGDSLLALLTSTVTGPAIRMRGLP